MKLNAHWPSILEAARLGDLDQARLGRQLDPSGPLADYFYGRSLTEAGVELEVAIPCLQRAAAAEPNNPLIIQTLALALARSEYVTNRAAAAEIWKKEGLPLDLDLLGQVSLTLEAQTRPWPAAPTPEPPWPAGLPEPGPEPAEVPVAPAAETGETPAPQAEAAPAPGEAGPMATDPEAPAPGCDKMTQVPATKKMGILARWRLGREIGRLEEALMEHHTTRVLEKTAALMGRGMDSAELHLVAGLAAEEAGLPRRARAHLSRADRLEPGMFLARTWLGRIYWRCGWHELALALWRSVPVEGPYDYGRHYHLALAHEALGNRAAALTAMGIAMDQFYFDTRHFHIKRALWAWQAKWAPELARG